MVFLAERAQSRDQKHPLLLYRLSDNTELCYRFRWTYTGADFHSYKCFGCCEAAKKAVGVKLTVSVLRVSSDYASFSSNPEDLNHVCQERGFTYRYLDSIVQQTYR